MRAELDACLLDPQLAQQPSDTWEGLPNPFPEFQPPEEEADA